MITIKSVGGKDLFVAESAVDVRAALAEAVRAKADLRGSDLRGSDLRGSDLRGSDLSRSDLSRSDLSRSDLSGSSLRGSDLSGSDLRGSDLRGSDLRGSDLSGSDLRGSDLSGSDLRGSDLSGSDLRGSDLRWAKNSDLATAQTVICPEGDIVGWKKCRDDRIVKLLIPFGAARSNASGRKCRAAYAIVTTIYDRGGAEIDTAVSQHDVKFQYHVGETVTPTEPFDTDRWNECAPGIHFYLTREEAQAW